MKKKVIVIGSGIGGIAAAVRMAAAGSSVQVFEVNDYPGGKISQIELEGFRFDAGPSLFTLPNLVDDLFALAGVESTQKFNYWKKKVACRYFWEDGTEITAYADRRRFAAEVEEQIGVAAQVVVDYLEDSERAYDATYPVFLEKSLHGWKNYFSLRTLEAITNIHRLHLTTSLNEHNEKQLKHPKLVQLFNRFATYNGSSPYLTPGVMATIPHLEHNLGTFYPENGMHSITKSLYQLSLDLGVEYTFEAPVDKILVENRRAVGVEVKGEKHLADQVFSNMDIVPTYRQLMPQQAAPEKTLSQPRSSSALIFYWGIDAEFNQLDLHNIFFSDDYKEEFTHIFERGTVYDDPTIYLNISSKEDPRDAPDRCENWFVMVNVPPNTGQDWDSLIKEIRQNVIEKLNRMLEIDLDKLIKVESLLDPRSIEAKTSSYQGALYGASSNNMMAALLRHPNFTRKIKNLYFCGGSVHPGGGIPLSLLSAKIATEIALKDNK